MIGYRAIFFLLILLFVSVKLYVLLLMVALDVIYEFIL